MHLHILLAEHVLRKRQFYVADVAQQETGTVGSGRELLREVGRSELEQLVGETGTAFFPEGAERSGARIHARYSLPESSEDADVVKSYEQEGHAHRHWASQCPCNDQCGVGETGDIYGAFAV